MACSRSRLPSLAQAALCVALVAWAPAAGAETDQPPPHPAAMPAAPQPTPVPPVKAPAPPVTDAMRARLATFVAALWPESQKRGVARELFDRAFTGLEPDTEIFQLLENQPEHVAAPWDYMSRLVSETRIENGRRKLAEHAEALALIEQRYGVDRHVVVAIWGVESSFGSNTGSRAVIRSLATLAVGDPRRPAFWRTELLTALTILQRGDITLERMTGSWAGAMGHTQFMPSSYVAHAADFDGDGRRDIWGSPTDALASTANYLKVAGWQTGEAWGTETVLPAGFDHGQAVTGTARTASEWQALGVTTPGGREWPRLGRSSVVLPAGARGPAFLTGVNFRAILRYNNALPYALAVGHLADRIAGGPGLAGIWPTDDPPLGKAQRGELQRRLSALGYQAGAPDGVIGQQTRIAIRAWQKKQGVAEDGWAGERLLEQLRATEK